MSNPLHSLQGCALHWPLLLVVVMLRPHCPGCRLMAGGEVARGLPRIAVDQRAQEHRMREASHLVLDGEQVLAAVKVDDVAEAVLVLVVLAVDQVAILETPVRSGKISD